MEKTRQLKESSRNKTILLIIAIIYYYIMPKPKKKGGQQKVVTRAAKFRSGHIKISKKVNLTEEETRFRKQKLGGNKIEEDQRKYFLNAMQEVKDLAKSSLTRKVRRNMDTEKLIDQGRKVPTQQTPLATLQLQRSKERTTYSLRMQDAIVHGKPMPAKPEFMKTKEKRDTRALDVHGGKYTKGTLHLGKRDIKSAFK
ncbi:hypothetical protein DFA_07322 [Cavenderia fasciculata]|uniref:Uncharacterized protein n=1 Tax=Cavenderia fasciculata TaxID=261658 RepID=F4PW38_CACFS|nr:uncharacterized protein DFA_07322 [Cavenderia fasciculata]EGG20202.1 hypothetical protein DFA_07322 [Cavenderia fasciculata]|eukprot:XP_004367185.1 hypothetical protein DFA_07322 [Cavenderia fasciculata]